MLRLLVAAVAVLAPSLALACGCFAAPDPSVPVVQPGERIVFPVTNGEVTAHVQVLDATEARLPGDPGPFGGHAHRRGSSAAGAAPVT
jgi:hypothetical protein